MTTKEHNGKAVYMIAALAAIVFLAIAMAYLLSSSPMKPLPDPASFTVGNKTFAFSSYALNITESEKGLMNATVTNMTFMIFIFHNSSIFPFWMKNTYAPLDIIWIEGNSSYGRIVYIVNATPCISYDPGQANCTIYTPTAVADYVIEAQAGFVQRNNVSLYQQVRFNYK